MVIYSYPLCNLTANSSSQRFRGVLSRGRRTNRTQLHIDNLTWVSRYRNSAGICPSLHPSLLLNGEGVGEQADTGLVPGTQHYETHGSYAHGSSPGHRVALGSDLSHSLAHRGYAQCHCLYRREKRPTSQWSKERRRQQTCCYLNPPSC